MKERKDLNEFRKVIKKIISEEFGMLEDGKITLTFMRPDENTGNFLYKGSDDNIYISIDGVIHDTTSDGEPLGPVYDTVIKKGEPIYNPEDRFGRNPGSKLQTETKDVYAMYRKAGMEAPHPGKGIHTKKFHKCVTSVGDEGGKNPYAICMSKLGKEKAVKSTHRTDEVTEKPIEQRENLEYFLSFNNDTLYWNWINAEISDSEAIELMKDIENMEYDPNFDYKKHYSGDDDETINEIGKPIAPISDKTKATLTRWIEEKGAQKAAADLVDRLSQTGMISSFPDSNEYGQGINKIEVLLSKGNLDLAYHSAKALSKRLEKKANKELGF